MNHPRPPRLVFLLTRASSAVRSWTDARVRSRGVTAATAGALMYIASNPGVTMGQLGAALQASPAGISGLASRMEAAGLIERTSGPDDQRVIQVALTARGAETAEAARLSIRDLNAELTAGFDDAELAVVARWLSHVADTLREERLSKNWSG